MTLSNETRLLAAIAYGEASPKCPYEEMAAIATVTHRQAKARGFSTVAAFVAKVRSFTFVVKDGNRRYGNLMAATEKAIEKDDELKNAVKAADNALSGGFDYSDGAYFWDGADIKSNYSAHPKVNKGVHFSKSEHNIYKIRSTEGKYEVTLVILKKIKGKEVKETKILGTCPYMYESTAAWGGTIFWKFGEKYLEFHHKEHI